MTTSPSTQPTKMSMGSSSPTFAHLPIPGHFTGAKTPAERKAIRDAEDAADRAYAPSKTQRLRLYWSEKSLDAKDRRDEEKHLLLQEMRVAVKRVNALDGLERVYKAWLERYQHLAPEIASELSNLTGVVKPFKPTTADAEDHLSPVAKMMAQYDKNESEYELFKHARKMLASM